MTSFNPDQISSTAHTFTSTSPSGNASARTVSSEMSVVFPDDFFGHETQIIPFGARNCLASANLLASSHLSVTKICTICRSGTGWLNKAGREPLDAMSADTLSGMPTRHVFWPSTTPSFLANGVPEYPDGMARVYSHHRRRTDAEPKQAIESVQNLSDENGASSYLLQKLWRCSTSES